MTTEEILKSHKGWVYNKTDENGTRYFMDYCCHRCGGKGLISLYKGIDGGVCFKCGGSGRVKKPEIQKIYTPEYEEKLAKEIEKKAQEDEARKKEAFDASLDSQLMKIGFGCEEGKCVLYRVIGNTYPIKEELKKAGCRFNSTVGWFSAKPLEGRECQRMEAADLVDINTENRTIEWKSREQVEPLFTEIRQAAEASTSDYQGEIGSKLDIVVTVDKVVSYDHDVGWRNFTSNWYFMHDAAGNVYTWSTAKALEIGNTYHFKCTVKDHHYNKGIKQTVVTRCSLVV